MIGSWLFLSKVSFHIVGSISLKNKEIVTQKAVKCQEKGEVITEG